MSIEVSAFRGEDIDRALKSDEKPYQWPSTTEIKHIVGLDLGQVNDYTALVSLRREQEVPDPPKTTAVDPEVEGWDKILNPNTGSKPKQPAKYYCNIAERMKSDYTDLADKMCKLFQEPKFSGETLVVDGTGVGRGVVDIFRKAFVHSGVPVPVVELKVGDRESVLADNHGCEKCGFLGFLDLKNDTRIPCPYCPKKAKWVKPKCVLMPVTITGGSRALTLGSTTVDDQGYWHVPKKELVSSVQVVLSSDRLSIAPGLKFAAVLVNELKSFSYKIGADSAHVSFECLVGGTMVETRAGPKPIERIEKGQDVLTRFGYNKVLWAGETKRVSSLCTVRFDNGSTLRGTPNHLVWTENRGWVEMENLTCQDLCIGIPRQSFSTGSLITGARHTPITSDRITENERTFTERCGGSTTARSRRASISTTRMRIGTTTTFLILNACQTRTIKSGIGSGPLQSLRSAQCAKGSLNAGRQEERGLRKERTARKTSIVPCGAFRSGLRRSGYSGVFDAARSSQLLALCGRFGFALPNAREHTSTFIRNTQPLTASTVVSRSKSSTEGRSIVRPSAPPFIEKCSRDMPVYDLIVDGNHEFFANGVLVHNSWREKDHDDLVLALAMAAWAGERTRQELWVR